MFSVVSKLLRLAWPVTLARLGIMVMGVVDVMVVGQLAPEQLSHQALGWAPTSVLVVTGIGMLTGVQVLAARALGAGDLAAVGGAWRRGLVASVIGGAFSVAVLWVSGARLFTLFGIAPELARPSAAVMRVLVLSVPLHLIYVATAYFFEAIQRPMASTVVMWCANAINLVLNLVLVPRYGAIGSAWATFGARVFLCVALGIWALRLKDAVRLGLYSPAKGPTYREFFAVGFAAAVSHAAEAGAFSAMTIIAGRSGEHPVAAYQILLNLIALVFMVSLGVSTAATVLTSEAVGLADAPGAARTSWTGLLLNTAIMCVIGVILALFASPIAHAYTADAEVGAIVAVLIPLLAVIIVPDGGQTVVASVLRAHRDNWFPTASHLLAYAFIMPAIALTLAEGYRMGVSGLLLAILGSSVCSVGILTIRLRFLTRRLATI